MKEKDLRKYQDRRLIRVPVPGTVNIRRRYVWNKQAQRYVDPPRGSKYEARRSKGKGSERETKVFDALSDARAWQAGHIADRPAALTDHYLVGDLLADWQRLAWPSLKESTRIFYSKVIEYFDPILAIEVESLTPRHIDEWLTCLKSPAYLARYRSTRHTLEKEFDAFKAMVNWHIERHDETQFISPFKKRHRKMLKIREKASKAPKFMAADDLEKWLACLRQDSFLFYALALTQVRQVLRISEAAAMTWQNLDLSNRVYIVTDHVIWPRVNGAQPKILPGTKTMKGGETFASNLWADVAEIFEKLIYDRKGELIFTLDGSPLTYRQIQHRYDMAFKRAGLPYRSTHVCRHTGATNFIAKTNDPLALQQMGNWKDLRMALHYGQILSTRAKDAIEQAEKRGSHLKLVSADSEEAG